MWPWGHLAFGYLCYLPYERRRGGDASSWLALCALAVGTQLPDLVDKPLAWTVRVLPSGRSFAHSLLTLAVVVGVLYWVCTRYGRVAVSVAFGVGYASHLAADSVMHVVAGEFRYLVFLVWPLLGAPPYGDEGGFLSHFATMAFSPFFYLQLVLVVAACVVFLARRRRYRAG